MKKLFFSCVFFFLLIWNLASAQMTRNQYEQIFNAAATTINNDLGKSYSSSDAFLAYQAGALTIQIISQERGKLTVQYNFTGCVGVILLDD